MRFLDKLELFLTEEKEEYNLFPVDYDLESGISFGVEKSDDDKVLAKVAIKTIDGVPVDALNGNYNHDEVYADINLEGDTDDPSKADLMLWILKKIKNMGYDEQSIRFDGDSYYEKPETLSDITTDDDEPVESDKEFDPSSYWDDREDEDISASEDDNSDAITDFQFPDDTTSSEDQDEEEPHDDEELSDEDDDDEETKDKKE